VSSPCQCCWPRQRRSPGGSAFAQTPTSTFDEVNARLRPGDRVTVTDAQQRTISGRVEEISTSSPRMMVDAKRQDFALHDLLRIERRTSDSLLNGALIGAAIGGALFLKHYSENALCQSNCQFTSGALGLIGIGAAAGIGLDALMRYATVFERSLPPPRVRDGSRALDGTRWSISLEIEW
jgi:hypothetical protein